jgi:hypothetical protein
MSYAYSSRTRSNVLVRLLQFLLNFKIDIADSDRVSVKLAVDEELKDSRSAINDFDCGVFLFLEASKSTVFIFGDVNLSIHDFAEFPPVVTL